MSRNKVINGSLMPVAGVVKLDNTNFVGTVEEWNALSHSQRSQYLTADITNDFMYIMYDYNCPAGATSKGGVTPTQTKRYGVDITIENSGFNPPDGYNFVGWNTAPDGSGTDYAAGATYSGNAAMILYAKWEAKPVYNVYWNNPLAQYNFDNEVTVNYLGDETYIVGQAYTGKEGWKRILTRNKDTKEITGCYDPFQSRGNFTILKDGSEEIVLQMVTGIKNNPYSTDSRIRWNLDDYITGNSSHLIETILVPNSPYSQCELQVAGDDCGDSYGDIFYQWEIQSSFLPTNGMSVGWVSGTLSQYGSFLGDGEYIVGNTYEGKEGWKRIKYIDPDLGVSYIDPCSPMEKLMNVKPGTPIYFEMVAGTSDESSEIGWDKNQYEETAHKKNSQFIQSPAYICPDYDPIWMVTLSITQDEENDIDTDNSYTWIIHLKEET